VDVRRTPKQRALGAVLLVLLIAGVVALLPRGDRKVQDRPPAARSAENDGPAPLLTADARPPAPADPPAEAPVEISRPEVPAGGLRLVVYVPGRRRGDETSVVVSVLREGHATATFFWHPDLGDAAWSTDDTDDLGPRVQAREESSAEDGSSLMLTGLEEGDYSFHARSTLCGVDTAEATAHARVRRDGATVRLEVPVRGEPAALTIRLRQGGVAAQGVALIRWQDLTLHVLDVSGEAGATVPVPADTDLEVEVSSFRGSEGLGKPAPKRVRVPPNARAVVDLELPTGVDVRVSSPVPVPEGEEPPGLRLWRRSETGTPVAVSPNALVPPRAGNAWSWGSWEGQLPTGRYELHATSVESQSWQTFDVVAPGPVEVRVAWEARGGTPLRTRWRKPDGTPATHLPLVMVRAFPSTLRDSVAFYTATDAEGRARFPRPGEGIHGIFLWHEPLYRLLLAEEAASAEEVEITLPHPDRGGDATLRGRVEGPSGLPVPVNVLVERDDPLWFRVLHTDAEGAFQEVGMAPGSMRLHVQVAWYQPVSFRPHVQDVVLRPGDNEEVVIRLRAP
jgi:hypothetical protein